VTSRVRCCIAVTFDEAVEFELNVARSLLGSTAVDRILPHITLVPPIDLPVDEAWGLVERIGSLATKVRPIELELAGFATFANRRISGHVPVIRGTDELAELRNVLGPLDHSRPYVPHVTIIDAVSREAAQVLSAQLANYRLVTQAKEVTLLVADIRGGRRRWRPLVRALLGYGGPRRRSHRTAIAMLSRTGVLANLVRSPGLSCWLVEKSGEVLGWVEAVPGPSGVWVLAKPVVRDPESTGFGLEELMVDELVGYLRPASIATLDQHHPLDDFGARRLSREEAALLGLDSVDPRDFGLLAESPRGVSVRSADGSQGMRWKFLSFSTR
jgi:2'-5' RNA ligase